MNLTHQALDKSGRSVQATRSALKRLPKGPGLYFFVAVLLILSAVAGTRLEHRIIPFKAGEIASSEISADRDILVEDQAATKLRRDQIAQHQPAVFDLSSAPTLELRQKINEFLRAVNTTPREERGMVIAQFAEQTGVELTESELALLSRADVQRIVQSDYLLWLESRLLEGVVPDVRMLFQFQNGVLIRNPGSGSETPRADVQALTDINSLYADFLQYEKDDNRLTQPMRRAVAKFIQPLLSSAATLNYNPAATSARIKEVVAAQEPVVHTVQQGEVIVRPGERVSEEQALKLKVLAAAQRDLFHADTVFGLLFTSLIFALGLIMSPSGKPGRPLLQKDFFFIGLMLLCFGLGAKGLALLVEILAARGTPVDLVSISYAFPIAGVAGIAATIFSARRYCVTGLLLAFFCSIMLHGGISLFLCMFIASMWSTWLVTRAQTRIKVLWSFFPLAGGLMVICVVTYSVSGLPAVHLLFWLLLAAVINSLVSLFLLFALSPIVELSFGYTTRFRLMELMNLEQPILQELMVATPGTYHHSLVVSNMVEAAAKAIGANALLCKVAALYHDLGKLSRPEYFIENQFSGENRHDKLSPSMSALILISHVKKGTELARQNRLGQEIIDIITQHHGTSTIRYFYQKALDMGEAPRKEEFQYPGPRPQTREAAIIMLADAVEASSRTLQDPTPARIQNHVETVVKGIFADGQLDESELTFQDLTKLSDHFHRVLTGLFHQRIGYPDAKSPAKPAQRPAPPDGQPHAPHAPSATDQPKN